MGVGGGALPGPHSHKLTNRTTFKYLQEQELPQQSSTNLAKFQIPRLVHRNHSARKTRTNRKLALRQSSAVHSTWNNFDRTRVNDKKTRKITQNGAQWGQILSPSHRPIRLTRGKSTPKDALTATWWRDAEWSSTRDVPTFRHSRDTFHPECPENLKSTNVNC